MNVDTASQYRSPEGGGGGHRPGRYKGETYGDQDADSTELALQRTIQHAAHMSLATFSAQTRGQEDNQEIESTPVVKSQGLITFTGPGSSQPKELVDVKKRISLLMGNPQGSSSSSPSHRPLADSSGRRASDVEQENTSQFGFHPQRI